MQKGQLSIEHTNNGDLRVSLPNYPLPDDTEGGMTPTPLWEDPETGELQGEPPVEHEDQSEDYEYKEVKIIKRKDNGEVCGFLIDNFSYGDNASLIKYREDADPILSINPPEI